MAPAPKAGESEVFKGLGGLFLGAEEKVPFDRCYEVASRRKMSLSQYRLRWFSTIMSIVPSNSLSTVLTISPSSKTAQDPLPPQNPPNSSSSARARTHTHEHMRKFYFFIHLNLQTPAFHSKSGSPIALCIASPFRFFLNNSMKFSHKSLLC